VGNEGASAEDEPPTTASDEALRRSDERFRTIMGASFEGLTIMVDGRIVESNESFARMVGYGRDELVGRHPVELCAPESVATVVSHVRAGDETPYEVVAVRKDGSRFPCEVLGRNIVWDGKAARLTGFRDLTERHRVYEERRRLEERANSAQKLETLGVLAAGIAHDFNNLLHIILAHADLALHAEVSPEVRDSLTAIRQVAVRSRELTQQLQTYGGNQPPQVAMVDLDELVREMTELLRVSVSHTAELTVVGSRDPLMLLADAGQLRQVVLNLVVNASEALGERGGAVSLRTRRVRLQPGDLAEAALDATAGPGSFACLEVGDTGSGIEAAHLSRIFDPFFSTKFQGRGLGLASVIGILRGHRGAITVASEPGRGSRFSMYFPLSSPAALSGSADEAAPPEPAPAPQFAGLVLVADDEPAIRHIARRTLESLGFTVVVAASGIEALELHRARAAEVVLAVLDLTMPGGTGLAALQELRRDRPDLPVIVMSGHGPDDSADELRRARAHFLAKPFSLDDLISAVKQALERART
jgi:PAS domain S-box-containing protein